MQWKKVKIIWNFFFFQVCQINFLQNNNSVFVCIFFHFFSHKIASTKTRTSKKIQSGHKRNFEIAKYNTFVDSTLAISTCHSRDSPEKRRRSPSTMSSNWSTSWKQWNVFGANVCRRSHMYDPCQTCNIAKSWYPSTESIGWTALVPEKSAKKEKKRKTKIIIYCNHN